MISESSKTFLNSFKLIPGLDPGWLVGRRKSKMWHDPAVSLGLDPQALRLAAEPPFVLRLGPNAGNPSPQSRPPSTITQPIDTATLGDTILERVMTALAPYLTAITDLTATANGGGNNQGEPASNNPPPSITSRPAALSKNLPEARLAFDHIPALTIEAISENGFDIKDLWKLDPLRIAELNHSGSRQLPLPARTGDERY